MGEPVTHIDRRFSDPETVALGWDETRQALEEAQLFWVSTVRADGHPHITPLVAVWLDEAIYFCTGPTEQKTLNLQENQHVILLTGCNQWDTGLDIVVEGDAVQITDNETLLRLAQKWSTKWDGRWQYEVRDGSFHHGYGSPLVFEVKPTKIFAFTKGSFSQTRHQF